MDKRFERSEKIIRQAYLDLLSNKINSKISVSDICRLAECSRNTFYLHYDSKDHLLETIFDDIIDAVEKSCRPVVKDFTYIGRDEPEWLAGTNKGPNPVEYLLSALGGCLSLSFILSANNKNHEIKGLDVEVTGDVDLNILLGIKEGNPGVYNLNVTFNVDTEIEDLKIEELMHDALSISVVGNTIQSKVQINPEYKRK